MPQIVVVRAEVDVPDAEPKRIVGWCDAGDEPTVSDAVFFMNEAVGAVIRLDPKARIVSVSGPFPAPPLD